MPDQTDNMIDLRGKADFCRLRDFAQHSTLSGFLEAFPYPFLTGRDLYASGMHRTGHLPASKTLTFIRNLCRGELHCSNDPGPGQSVYAFRSGKQTFSIGRAPDNDIVLEDPSVSKRHAQILLRKDEFFLTDLSSTNGTHLENRLIDPQKDYALISGALIGIGKLEFIFAHPMMVYRAFRRDSAT